MGRYKKNWITLFANIRSKNGDAIRITFTKVSTKALRLLCLPIGLLFVVSIRLIRPWFLVRIEILVSERMGHFAANTELYLCERDAGINQPKMPYVDLWYCNWPICNRQLARMWSRVLHIWPAWLLAPASKINSWIPGGDIHRIGDNSCLDRDVHNLLERFPAHLQFLPEEEERGQAGLRAIGIPQGARFVCLNVRDGLYLKKSLPWKSWDYHSYRNCNIQNYVLASEKLVELGYYVVRMGASVEEAMNVSHPQIIDYAWNGIRTDFMDIYLGAKCDFCISNGTGFDAVPYIFRRPIVYVDHVPIGIFNTFCSNVISLTKKHWSTEKERILSLSEIFSFGAANFYYSSLYEDAGIELVESSPKDIADVVVEMAERCKGTWQSNAEVEELQKRFWQIYEEGLEKSGNRHMHGELRSFYGSNFLKANKEFLK